MKKLSLIFAALLFCSLCFAQTQNPTGLNYSLSGNGAQVQTTNGVGGAGQQPCYDAGGNLTPTCSNAATGLGVYLFTVGRQDTGCVQIAVSEDGRAIRPLTWPLDPYTSYSYCSGTVGTSTAGGMFSNVFLAPWNSTYYLIGNTGNGGVFVVSSPDLITWSSQTSVYTDGTPATLAIAAASELFFDAPAQCPNQDYTCFHVIVPIVLVSSGNYQPYEIHPTNSTLTAWSTPTQLASGVVVPTIVSWFDYVVNYGGTYYLFFPKDNGGSTYDPFLYSASTLTGTYTQVGNMAAAWCGGSAPPCSNSTVAGGGIEDISIVWTGTAWRAYLHPEDSLLGEFYVENATSPVALTGWTAPYTTYVNGVIDQGGQLAGVFRTADPKTISIAAATARQSVLPLWTPRGLGNCDAYSDTFNTPGAGGPFNGMCAGIEHVSLAQQGTYQALRIFAENPAVSYGCIGGSPCGQGNIDLGNYTSPTAFTTWIHLTQAGSVWGSATGGAKGAGTINAAGLYVNGTAIAAGGTACTTTANSLQYDNSGAFGCVPDFTFSSPHTLLGGASAIFDMHAASPTAGWLPPQAAGAAPTTAGVESFDTTAEMPKFGDGSVTHYQETTRLLSFSEGAPGGSALSAGVIAYQVYQLKEPCTIKGWSIAVDAGTATVKTWKIASGTAIPTTSNSISTSGVSISTGTVIESTTVTDFTTATVSAGDIIAADLSATSGAGFINFNLECVQ